MEGPTLSQHVIDAIDMEMVLHVPQPIHDTVGAAGPFSIGAAFAFIAPYLIKALQYFLAQGVTPTHTQLLAHAAHLASAETS